MSNEKGIAQANHRRSARDPRVAEVLTIVDRMLAGEAGGTQAQRREAINESVLKSFGVMGWSDDAIRAVLRAILVNAPEVDVWEMLGDARASMAEVARYNAACLRDDANDDEHHAELAQAGTVQ